MSPPTSELSPPFMEFCTAFDRTRSKTRSNGASCPTCRLPVRRRRTIKKTYTTAPRARNSHQGMAMFHIFRLSSVVGGGGASWYAAKAAEADDKKRSSAPHEHYCFLELMYRTMISENAWTNAAPLFFRLSTVMYCC